MYSHFNSKTTDIEHIKYSEIALYRQACRRIYNAAHYHNTHHLQYSNSISCSCRFTLSLSLSIAGFFFLVFYPLPCLCSVQPQCSVDFDFRRISFAKYESDTDTHTLIVYICISKIYRKRTVKMAHNSTTYVQQDWHIQQEMHLKQAKRRCNSE